MGTKLLIALAGAGDVVTSIPQSYKIAIKSMVFGFSIG
jgi:hypothetical protein